MDLIEQLNDLSDRQLTLSHDVIFEATQTLLYYCMMAEHKASTCDDLPKQARKRMLKETKELTELLATIAHAAHVNMEALKGVPDKSDMH